MKNNPKVVTTSRDIKSVIAITPGDGFEQMVSDTKAAMARPLQPNPAPKETGPHAPGDYPSAFHGLKD